MNATSKEVKVAITITARRMEDYVPRWLRWIEKELRSQQCPNNINRKKNVVCTHYFIENAQKDWLTKNVGCKPERYWCKIDHKSKGAGDIWREACRFSFDACQCGQSTNIQATNANLDKMPRIIRSIALILKPLLNKLSRLKLVANIHNIGLK